MPKFDWKPIENAKSDELRSQLELWTRSSAERLKEAGDRAQLSFDFAKFQSDLVVGKNAVDDISPNQLFLPYGVGYIIRKHFDL